MLKKKVKVTIQGFAKPQWFVATPLEVQPEGGISLICALDVGTATANGNTTSYDSPFHVVTSGVSIMSWNGGNLPETEELLYHYVYKKSSFTVLVFAIIIAIVTFGVASALIFAVGPAALGGLGAASAAAIGAGVYAGVAALSGAGITSAQAGWAGSTGNGLLVPNTGAMSSHQRGLNQGITNKQILSRAGTGLQGYQELYHGNCPETMSGKECLDAGLDTGSMHRTDSFRETNVVRQLREAEARCKLRGLTGRDLAICAAPRNGEWTIDTGL